MMMIIVYLELSSVSISACQKKKKVHPRDQTKLGDKLSEEWMVPLSVNTLMSVWLFVVGCSVAYKEKESVRLIIWLVDTVSCDR